MELLQRGGFVVGWGTLALINAGLAQSKGRSGLSWWALSLLIGPLATLLIVVYPHVRWAENAAGSKLRARGDEA